MTDKNEAIRLESMQQYGFGTETMKSIKVCAHCGAMSSAAETNCRECHSPLPQETMFHIYKHRHIVCPKCETVVADKARFCPQCGAKIHREIVGIGKG